MKQKELIASLEETIKAQAETIRTLQLMVEQLKNSQLVFAPAPVQPYVQPNTQPQPWQPWPPYTPYVGDPPSWPYGGTASPNIGIATCSAGESQ